MYGYFKRQTEIALEKTCKGKIKRENDSLLMAAQNNAIRTNYIKAKIDDTQRSSKCRLYREKKMKQLIT